MDHLSKYLALRIALERRQQQEAGEPGGPGGGASDAGGPDGGGGEGGGAGGGDGPEEPALPSLEGVSEKQYTIYIAPGGGAFTVRASEGSAVRGSAGEGGLGPHRTMDPTLTGPPSFLWASRDLCLLPHHSLCPCFALPQLFYYSFFLSSSLGHFLPYSYPLLPSPIFFFLTLPLSLFHPFCRH